MLLSLLTIVTSATAARIQFRATSDNGGPAVGSAEWKAQYPAGFQVADPKPEWLTCLNAAESQKLIPNIPITNGSSGYAVYPAGTDGKSASICSWTANQCFGPNDIHTAKANQLVISFDDGPTNISPPLFDFLKQNNVQGSHFMIGSNILTYPQSLIAAFQAGQHLGIHTWAHHSLTTLTNEQIVGEIGWTAQIIMDLTGGLVPAFYRPPEGDLDNRVRAVIDQCFGMTAVFWSYDTSDWKLLNAPDSQQAGILAQIDQGLTTAYNGPQTPGLVPLHHEITVNQIKGFTDTFALAQSKNWKMVTFADVANKPWYLNAASNTGSITSMANPAARTAPIGGGTTYAQQTSSTPSNGATTSTSTSTTSSTTSATSQSATPTSGAASTAVSWILAGCMLSFVIL